MKKQYLFLILVIYLIGCIMNLCYYIVSTNRLILLFLIKFYIFAILLIK